MELAAHIEALRTIHGASVGRSDLEKYSTQAGVKNGLLAAKLPKLKRGTYSLSLDPATQGHVPIHPPGAVTALVQPTPHPSFVVTPTFTASAEVPIADKDFVPFGDYAKIKHLVASNQFFTAHIVGHSGNGKTSMVEQACAETKRKMVLVTVTEEIRESDLFGSIRLVNGNTVYQPGPVVEAMRSGAVLLLDELPQGNPQRLMALQNVLAGKSVFVKTTCEWVHPLPGFCVISTGNSRGDGDTSNGSLYSGEQHLNGAMSDRIMFTFDHHYPTESVERKILDKKLPGETDFVKNLVLWANGTRRLYQDGGVNKMITTRRLIDICMGYTVFKDKVTSLDLCLARFDADTANSFRTAYFMIDPTLDPKRLERKG